MDDIKKKWKSLRDNFRKELKKKPTRRSGASREETEWVPQWKFFNSMVFLQDEVMPEQGSGNLNLPLENSSEDGISARSGSPTASLSHHNFLEDDENTLASNQSLGSNMSLSVDGSAHSTRPRLAEQRQQMLKLEEEKIALLKSRIADSKKEEQLKTDEDYLFLMSILPSMKRLSNYQKLRFRHKITEIMLEMSSYNEYPHNMFIDNNISVGNDNNLSVGDYTTHQPRPQYFTSNSTNVPSASTTSSQPQYFTSDATVMPATSITVPRSELSLSENENQEEETHNPKEYQTNT